ncbi:MAG TPA: hypothetical protein VNY05_21710 [Candidatus Acidoferrales bacterium]|jgi:hypothetical protein|nr:hypothetical protein [Candidatus Acidoferrales bacterium]
MSYGRAYAFLTLAVVTVLALPADGQSVISTRSGIVHFFEGAVYLADQPLEPHFGRFPSMAEGAELRTAQGRAEVLLMAGVFLRMGESSAIRLVANDLSDTRVEMLSGSAMVDSAEPGLGTSFTLVYKAWRVHFPQKGIYRIDADPPRLWVQQGEAEVFAGGTGMPVSVEQGMYLPFAPVLVPERSIDLPGDALTDWAKGRSESISADNAITAQIDEDPASRNSGLETDSFAYFPLIGVPSLGLGLSGGYGSFNPYQPGFNAIYLPGYTYRPLLVGLAPGGVRSYLYSPTRRVGVSPRAFPIVPAPHAPLPHPAPGRPMPPAVRGGAHR